MKKISFLVFFFLKTAISDGQYLTQSADGKSSIPLPLKGVGIGVDIGKTEVVFGLNNYASVLKDSAKLLLGFNLSAKNSEGLANLFSAGDIVPQGEFLGFTGMSFSNNKRIIENFNKSEALLLFETERMIKLNLFEKLKVNAIIDVITASDKIADLQERQVVINDMRKKIRDFLQVGDLRKYIKEYDFTGIDLDRFKKKLAIEFSKHDKEYTANYNMVAESATPLIDNAFNEFVRKQVPVRTTLFLQGGINARSFTRFLQLNTPDFSKSFRDSLFRVGIFGVGVNLQVKSFWVGVTYSYVKGDNFVSLNSKEYTLRTIDTAGNQDFIREKKTTAYSGKYSRVESNQLNIDLVGDFKLSDTSRLLANLYLRGLIYSRDTSYLKNYVNIGAGLYFIGNKGKFLGGLYVELPDINNNIEKAKPDSETNIRKSYKKLTFGIVTKFNLSSVFAWVNRPVKPD